MKAAKLFQTKLFVKKSPMHGYGVFAGKNIKKGEKIEECYMLVSRGGDKKLEDYYFDAKGKNAIFLGFGCIYNHADTPNADYTINMTNRIATIKAKRNIRKDEEILVSYGPKWFSSRGWEAKDADGKIISKTKTKTTKKKKKSKSKNKKKRK